MPLPSTWSDLFHYVLPRHASQVPSSSTGSTAEYSNRHPPPNADRPTWGLLDPTLTARLYDGLERYLRNRKLLQQPLSPSLLSSLTQLEEVLGNGYGPEADVMLLLAIMYCVWLRAIHDLCPEMTTKMRSPPILFSQQGDQNIMMIFTQTVSDSESDSISTAIGVEAKRVLVLETHLEALTNPNGFQIPPGVCRKHCAMAIKLALQMQTSSPSRMRFGMFFTSLGAVIAEEGVRDSRNGLFLSEAFTFASGPHPSIPDGRQFHRIIALGLAMLIPGLEIAPSNAASITVLAPIPSPGIEHKIPLLPSLPQTEPQGHGPTNNSQAWYDVPFIQSGIEILFCNPHLSSDPRQLVQRTFTTPPPSSPPYLPPILSPSSSSGSISGGVDQPIQIVLTSVAGTGGSATVWRGMLNVTKPVVAKLISQKHWDQLVTESVVYDKLSVHGVTPYFRGTFVMPDESFAAIVLDDLGDSLADDGAGWHLADIKWHLKGSTTVSMQSFVALRCQLATLHACGYEHFDFEPRNVMNSNGSLSLIDFGFCQSHICPGVECEELDLCEKLIQAAAQLLPIEEKR